jgi:hypothetical protein
MAMLLERGSDERTTYDAIAVLGCPILTQHLHKRHLITLLSFYPTALLRDSA